MSTAVEERVGRGTVQDCRVRCSGRGGCRDPPSRMGFAFCYLWKHWSHNDDVKQFNGLFVRNAAITWNAGYRSLKRPLVQPRTRGFAGAGKPRSERRQDIASAAAGP